MNIFDQYGIKEVADVTLYSIHRKEDGSGNLYYMPAIHFDTLKISSIEKTAENVWAEGGLGNARLISWDFGKQINVSLQDALCTPASLGLCWDGVLSADWKDADVQVKLSCQNSLDKLSLTQKAIFPRYDKNAVVSNLLPRIKSDKVDEDLGILKTSSVVDGTVVAGTGMVANHTYNWKMAIESAVQSIAVVPDRFFDVTGKSYPIDWNRKVSVHSLPDYENYKQAIIYRINTRGNCIIPPLAKIIFDGAMETTGELTTVTLSIEKEEDITPTVSLAEILSGNSYTIYEEGLVKNGEDYFIPVESLFTTVPVKMEEAKGKYEITTKLFKLSKDSPYIPKCLTIMSSNSYGGTLVSYLQNHAMTDLIPEDKEGNIKASGAVSKIEDGQYLAIVIDNNNNYIPLIGKMTKIVEGEDKEDEFAQTQVLWYKPAVDINVTQFKGIDMWLRFRSINELIYFLLTKYNDDIVSISAATLNTPDKWDVNLGKTTVDINEDEEANKVEGRLWAYINPRTMTPFDDDYWFHQGEPYLIKSLTLSTKNKKIKGHRIVVKADEWPGMYMMVGETWLRDRGTGNDQHMQIKIPLCKVKSDQTLTLEAGGDPTVFNLDLEVAKPANGTMMELIIYEAAQKMQQGTDGYFYAVDGSSEVLSE